MVPLLAFLAAAPYSGIGAATAAMADGVAQADSEVGTSGSVEVSFANATGNTENLTLIANSRLEVDRGVHEHTFQAGARYAESAPPDGERTQTQEAVFASYQLDADLSDRLFTFGRTRYDYDGFSGFEHRLFVGGGLGVRLSETETLNWRVTGGPGVRFTKLAEPDPRPDDFNDSQAEFSAYAGTEIAWDINDAVGFEYDGRVTYTETSTTLESEAGLRSKLTETLSARFSYRVQHETDPAPRRQATDTLLTAGLVLSF